MKMSLAKQQEPTEINAHINAQQGASNPEFPYFQETKWNFNSGLQHFPLVLIKHVGQKKAKIVARKLIRKFFDRL